MECERKQPPQGKNLQKKIEKKRTFLGGRTCQGLTSSPGEGRDLGKKEAIAKRRTSFEGERKEIYLVSKKKKKKK